MQYTEQVLVGLHSLLFRIQGKLYSSTLSQRPKKCQNKLDVSSEHSSLLVVHKMASDMSRSVEGKDTG
uniref:(California timema) hypothetical protein n=1 Tax=Timema californicum TaxID=61474 RepID=A0A7R9P9K4_TIMCA|nr:unnamed protein product [Timema californicum]